MAHLLRKLGASALLPRLSPDGAHVLPPLIGKEEAMRIRAQFYKHQQCVASLLLLKYAIKYPLTCSLVRGCNPAVNPCLCMAKLSTGINI